MYNLRCVYMCCWNIFNHKIFFLLWMSQLLHRSWPTGHEKSCWNICVFWHKVSVYCNFFTLSLMFCLCVLWCFAASLLQAKMCWSNSSCRCWSLHPIKIKPIFFTDIYFLKFCFKWKHRGIKRWKTHPDYGGLVTSLEHKYSLKHKKYTSWLRSLRRFFFF